MNKVTEQAAVVKMYVRKVVKQGYNIRDQAGNFKAPLNFCDRATRIASIDAGEFFTLLINPVYGYIPHPGDELEVPAAALDAARDKWLTDHENDEVEPDSRHMSFGADDVNVVRLAPRAGAGLRINGVAVVTAAKPRATVADAEEVE